MPAQNAASAEMKRRDVSLIVSVLAAALILFGLRALLFSEDGAYIQVQVDGEETARYPLAEDAVVEITGEGSFRNVLIIADGMADMTEADCPDKLCVKQAAISKNGQSIICLPHRVVVSVVGGEQPETDATAR